LGFGGLNVRAGGVGEAARGQVHDLKIHFGPEHTEKGDASEDDGGGVVSKVRVKAKAVTADEWGGGMEGGGGGLGGGVRGARL
jgi:hypothetical protein